ncbi:hypothetical protein [Ensifer aridi]|uniref:hypothetical protein n=1 Tax=Ensifer aridi TaxID=1708715 RepID=UPI000A00B398
MGEWIDFEKWPDCASMDRPGIVFEVTNGERSMLTTCIVPLPLPFDWEEQPRRFRAVPQPEPRHSLPIPKPAYR